MKMRAGVFNVQATLYRKGTAARDATYNTEHGSWVPFAYQNGSPSVAHRFWVSLQYELPSRSESVLQGLVIGKQRARLRMRYRSGIDSSMRWAVHYDDGDIDMQIIGGPAIIGRKEYLEFMVESMTS